MNNILLGGYFSGGSALKNPSIRGTWVRSMGQEDPLEKKMATHSSILAQRISWTEEPGGLQSMESPAKSQMTEPLAYLL